MSSKIYGLVKHMISYKLGIVFVSFTELLVSGVTLSVITHQFISVSYLQIEIPW